MLVLQKPKLVEELGYSIQILTKILVRINCCHVNGISLASHVVRPVVVAVRVGNHGETREVIPRAEHGPRLHPVPGEPNGKPVSEKVLRCSGHLELNLQLPIAGVDGLEKGIRFTPTSLRLPLPEHGFKLKLMTRTTVFQIAPCWLCWSCVSLMWVEVTMVLPWKSQYGTPIPAPVRQCG